MDQSSPLPIEFELTDLVHLQVGDIYASATEAIQAIQDYALKTGKSVKVSGRSGVHRVIECTSSGCSMYVCLYRKQINNQKIGLWYISLMCLDHKNCLSTAKPHTKQCYMSNACIFCRCVRHALQQLLEPHWHWNHNSFP